MKAFRHGKSYFAKYKFRVAFYILFTLCVSLSSIFLPYFSGSLIDNLVEKKDTTVIFRYCSGLIIVSLGRIVSGYITSILYTRIQASMGYEFNKDVIAHAQKASLLYIEKQKSSYLTQIINGDTNAIIIFCLTVIQNTIQNALVFIVPLIILLRMNLRMTFILAAVILAYAIVFFVFRKHIYKLNKEQTESSSRYFSKLNDLLKYTKYIKLHSVAEKMFISLHKAFSSLMKSTMKTQRIGYLYSSLDGIIGTITQLLLYIIGAGMILTDSFTIGMFTIFAGYFNMLFGSARYFFNFGSSYQSIKISCNRLDEILSQPTESDNGLELDFIEKIEVSNVSFSYGGSPVISDYSMVLERGVIYGLAGPNGIGKSTLIDIIIGLYSNEMTGQVLYNGISQKDINMPLLRQKHIGIAEQEPVLLDDTLLSNLVFDENNADEKKLLELSGIVNMQTFFDSSNEKLSYNINENNRNISGGEKQKIAIIRTLYKNPDLMIFDEPTSAVDSFSKSSFLNYLRKISTDKIIILVSHDREVLESCDEVIKLASIAAA